MARGTMHAPKPDEQRLDVGGPPYLGPVTRKIVDLRAATDDELIAEHDELATHTVPGTAFYLEELERRERRRSAEASDRLARKAFWLGVSNTVLALVAAIAAIIALFK